MVLCLRLEQTAVLIQYAPVCRWKTLIRYLFIFAVGMEWSPKPREPEATEGSPCLLGRGICLQVSNVLVLDVGFVIAVRWVVKSNLCPVKVYVCHCLHLIMYVLAPRPCMLHASMIFLPLTHFAIKTAYSQQVTCSPNLVKNFLCSTLSIFLRTT